MEDKTYQWIIWIIAGLRNQQNRACSIIFQSPRSCDLPFSLQALRSLKNKRGARNVFQRAVFQNAEAHGGEWTPLLFTLALRWSGRSYTQYAHV